MTLVRIRPAARIIRTRRTRMPSSQRSGQPTAANAAWLTKNQVAPLGSCRTRHMIAGGEFSATTKRLPVSISRTHAGRNGAGGPGGPGGRRATTVRQLTSTGLAATRLLRWPLVADHQFILATRDTGYRSLAAAICELLDNSLQAGANRIDVFLLEERDRTAERLRNVTIAVLDNGSGMDSDGLRTALQFGGSTRFNDRKGPGRFGMGLPNSSVSQTRRLEVYSWQRSSASLYSYLDVGEIAQKKMRSVPAPSPRPLPQWLATRATECRSGLTSHGTLVIWSQCDRLPHRKASTIGNKLHSVLGRTYRYSLRTGIRIFVEGELVEAVDPLLEWGSHVGKLGAARPYGTELRYELKVPGAPRKSSIVRVRFSLLPVRRWAGLPVDVRRSLGIIGGAGVSVVRSGREIDSGWYLMGAKRRENYDDWWRCEVRFDPPLDEYFGVTHSKQGVTPHPVLREIIAPDLERIARVLNAKVREEFRRVQTHAPHGHEASLSRATLGAFVRDSTAVRIAEERERFQSPLPVRARRYRIVHAPLDSARFFDVRVERATVVLTLNSDHPFHRTLSVQGSPPGSDLIDLLILGAARAEVAAGAIPPVTNKKLAEVSPNAHIPRLREFIELWSDSLAAFLDRPASSRNRLRRGTDNAARAKNK